MHSKTGTRERGSSFILICPNTSMVRDLCSSRARNTRSCHTPIDLAPRQFTTTRKKVLAGLLGQLHDDLLGSKRVLAVKLGFSACEGCRVHGRACDAATHRAGNGCYSSALGLYSIHPCARSRDGQCWRRSCEQTKAECDTESGQNPKSSRSLSRPLVSGRTMVIDMRSKPTVAG